MQMKRHGKKRRLKHAGMVLLILLAFATADAQTITLSLNNATLETTFREVEKQVHHRFVYTTEMLEGTKPVSITIKGASLEKALEVIFRNQPLEYMVDEDFIKVRLRTVSAGPVFPEVQGYVTNIQGEELAGVSVTASYSNKFTVTDSRGRFVLSGLKPNEELVFTSVGYVQTKVDIGGKRFIDVRLSTAINELDRTVVIAYGTTSQRLNTGNVTKLPATEIAKQPVSNVLAALEGRVPGMLVTQSTGMPGGQFKVQIRGQNSLSQGSEPYYIIDGVPFAPANANLSFVPNAAKGISPFSLFNPGDIESIEVLKDADATAIYGSRGANGVILITTKKGTAGKTKLDANIYTGFSRITRGVKMMNTQQYVAGRKEGFINDNVVANSTNAPDLFLWDTTRYTDLQKELVGGTAKTTNIQLSLSGGNAGTSFLLTTAYQAETTVMPTDLNNTQASVHLNTNHSSADKRFGVNLSATYTSSVKRLTISDLTSYINAPPNIKLFNDQGQLNWEEGGVTYRSLGMIDPNPFALLRQPYKGEFQNLATNLQVHYKLWKGLYLRNNLGYNIVFGQEVSKFPSGSLDPNRNPSPYSNFSNTKAQSWVAEPMLEYNLTVHPYRLGILLGGTWQENNGSSFYVNAQNYSSDLLLGSLSGAGNVTTTNGFGVYKYVAFFGRINLNRNDRYLLNLSGRRDGSSRFGEERRFSDFYSIGTAWIFSNEKLVKKLGFLSFGKIRGSYGLTGNDQIGDYKYFDSWFAGQNFQGGTTLTPGLLYNPDYTWEQNKKFELAVELGFINQRLGLSASYYNNRCGNQLVNYTLPSQTGFSSIVKNLDALIENRGLELQLNGKPVETPDWSWSNTISLTVNRNRLLRFPGLESSGYANNYIIGQPLSVTRLYQSLGVDGQTGLYVFNDANKDGKLDVKDRTVIRHLNPKFYGGFNSDIVWHGFQLSLFIDYRKQTGRNYLATLSTNIPFVSTANQPVQVLDRWQKAGDISDVQRLTANFGTAAYTAANSYLIFSDAVYSDASFIRVKNIAVSQRLPKSICKKIGVETTRVYANAQNLFTITNYMGADPENQNMYTLAPLKCFVIGIQITL
jgi:TonB-linked SusC/RagA family outer membrane protein